MIGVNAVWTGIASDLTGQYLAATVEEGGIYSSQVRRYRLQTNRLRESCVCGCIDDFAVPSAGVNDEYAASVLMCRREECNCLWSSSYTHFVSPTCVCLPPSPNLRPYSCCSLHAKGRWFDVDPTTIRSVWRMGCGSLGCIRNASSRSKPCGWRLCLRGTCAKALIRSR